MRVVLTSYPMVFQRPGGLANKVSSTRAALEKIGIEARLLDANRDRLSDFDIVHVFGTGSGNHRVVEAANDAEVPVVLSSVFSLPYGWFEARRNRLIHGLCTRLSRYTMNTSWGHTRRAVQGSARIVVLGDAEAHALIDGFGAEAGRVRIIPNGIADAFFEADPSAFRREWRGSRPLVLMSGAVTEAKNQLNAVRAVRDLDVDLVLFGPVGQSWQGYLDQCLQEGGGKTHYLGSRSLDDPFYVSAFAAAAATLLPSRAEVTPNVVLESLAAGTPAVCTIHTAWRDVFPESCFRAIDPENVDRIRTEVAHLLEHRPSPDECRGAVTHLRWASVAESLARVYEEARSAAPRRTADRARP